MPRFNSKSLPENIRRCMPREDRKVLDAPTNEELAAKLERAGERLLHDQFENWCRINGLIYVHSRMDRKSTIAAGHPDFTVLWKGRGCCVEFKGPGGTLSEDQKLVMKKLGDAQVPTLVTQDVKEAISWVKVQLELDILG